MTSALSESHTEPAGMVFSDEGEIILSKLLKKQINKKLVKSL